MAKSSIPNLSAADVQHMRDQLYVADSVLDVLSRALETINDANQGAHERNAINVARDRIMAVANQLDCSLLLRRAPEAA